MLGSKLGAVAIAAASLLTSVSAADVPNIVIKGSKFFYENNGTQFYIRGVAYQQDIASGGATSATTEVNDPLTDATSCKRDIPYLVNVRTNTIRVYSIDPTGDHDDCMTALADAGIYVLADLSSPKTSINRDDPAWNGELYDRYTSVIDTMQKYPNLLGFIAGNEVSNNASNADAIPFVKAAVRDMKSYIKTKKYRALGVGYAADDDPSIRAPLENYLNCGESANSIDFFGYNVYSWCGQSTLQESHYADRTTEFSNYSVPVFFAEYGCNKAEPRIFEETTALYGSSMNNVWSGGIVFEYFQAANNFGLVSVDGNTVSTRADYSNLSKRIATATPTGVQMASYTPSHTALRECPDSKQFPGWAAATALPPAPNAQLCSCMVKNLTCVAKASVKTAAYGELFNAACGDGNGICDGINKNGTTGQYGAYSMCDDSQKLSWAFNALYEDQAATNSANTDACNFSGNATKQSAKLQNSCKSLVSGAGGQAGTATSTAGAQGGGSGSSSSGAAASSSSDAGVPISIPAVDFGVLSLGAYLVTAIMTGAGMILL